MGNWKKAKRDDSKRTCRNCGYVSCKSIVAKNGYHLDGWVEVIDGFAWRRTCARWTPENEQLQGGAR